MLPNGVSATCTINNNDQPRTLTLVKTVTNDNGGTAAADGVDADGDRADHDHRCHRFGAGHQRCRSMPAPTRCRSRVARPATPRALVVHRRHAHRLESLVLLDGVSATCTINNDDQPATLTLVKTVTNDNGGTAVPTDWTLTATGPTADHPGVTGTPAVTNAPVNAGTYTLSRVRRTRRLHGRRLVLHRRHPHRPNSLVLPNGGNATCTINNNDQPPR